MFNISDDLTKIDMVAVPDVKTNIKVLLQAAVEKRLMADRRIGCLLSGKT